MPVKQLASAVPVDKLKKLGSSSPVLVAFILGLVAGFVFGDLVAFLSVIGDAFISLLQMTIIPYVVVSLIFSLGSLSYEQVRTMGVKIGILLLIIWGVGLVAMYTIVLSFPEREAGTLFSTSFLEPVEPVDFIELYIPTNPFFSLSQSYVPAIVLFCIATGLALIGVKEKTSLMEQANALSKAFVTITQYIVKLMPIGIFAMTAATAGTMNIDEFERLQVYFAAHIVMALLLTYWVLPAIIVCFTPFRFWDVARGAQDALITAFAAGNIFIVVPLLIERTKELYQAYDQGGGAAERYPDIIVPIVFTFPNLGKLTTIIFVLFAAWFAGSSVDPVTYVGVAINGLISLFGSVFLTVPMLLNDLELPADLFQLYVVSSLLSGRFTSLLAAMNIFIIAVGGTAMLAGIASINRRNVILMALLTPLVFGLSIAGTGMLLRQVVSAESEMGELIAGMSAAEEVPEAPAPPPPPQADTEPDGPRNVQEIIESGLLQVGYSPNKLPFSYQNDARKLVGFDIELMRNLAADLGVRVHFEPYKLSESVEMLESGQIDIAVSGVQMTAQRMTRVGFTVPVLQLHYGLVVRDHDKELFSSDKAIRERGRLTIATTGDYDIVPELEAQFPDLVFVPIEQDQDFVRSSGQFDALLTSAEAGTAWSLRHPQYTAVFRRGAVKSFPAAYAIALENRALGAYLNSWLHLQESTGKIQRLYDYWILGQDAVPKKRRWSVLKNIFGIEFEW